MIKYREMNPNQYDPQNPSPQPPPTGGQPAYPQQQPTYDPNQATQPNQPVQPQPNYQQAPDLNQEGPIDTSIDYLDKISAPAQTKSGPSNIVWISVIALGVLSVILGIFLLFFGGQPSFNKASATFARINTLQKIADEQHRYLRDNGLRGTNSSFRLALANAARDLQGPLEAAGINKDKLDKKLLAAEAKVAEDYKKKFEDARLNVTLDTTYSREMIFQIYALHTMIQAMDKSSNSPAVEKFAADTTANLEPIIKSFSRTSVTPERP